MSSDGLTIFVCGGWGCFEFLPLSHSLSGFVFGFIVDGKQKEVVLWYVRRVRRGRKGLSDTVLLFFSFITKGRSVHNSIGWGASAQGCE